ncbi:response regulator transcription factor [Lentzea sp. NBC_00516]|uniref:response regulator n=1 Tax=Lentzea sp. NBC_00516 TaxID=2903582 RepID=UPI002E80D560|nr:response regulator transcription factor [Lentzea sp. NBC_00516]WUD25437.1 response regulator transcription factor [Lentzea sp. NBC_00516]
METEFAVAGGSTSQRGEPSSAIRRCGRGGGGRVGGERSAAAVPDVLLMDLLMPGTDGLAATREPACTARVLVLTTYDSDNYYVVSAIEAGATGYLDKGAPRDEFVLAVRAIARGEAVLAPAAAAQWMKRGAVGGRRGAQLARVGGAAVRRRCATNREVARGLFTSEVTPRHTCSPSTPSWRRATTRRPSPRRSTAA